MGFRRKKETSDRVLTRADKANALKIAACMWLSKNGFNPFVEVTLDPYSRLRADVIALNRDGMLSIVEVKSSKQDFLTDHKFERYLPFANKFYFCADSETLGFIKEQIKDTHPEIGLLGLECFENIAPFDLFVNKPAKTLTKEPLAFTDRLAYQLLRSNCMFMQGNYIGLRKVDKSLISPAYCIRDHIESKLQDD